MKTALLRQLKRLEEVRAVETQPPVELQMGYLKRLQQEYTGERHLVTVGRAGDGKYRWEERRGAPPATEDGPIVFTTNPALTTKGQRHGSAVRKY